MLSRCLLPMCFQSVYFSSLFDAFLSSPLTLFVSPSLHLPSSSPSLSLSLFAPSNWSLASFYFPRYHCYCLDPPLPRSAVPGPGEPWFCPRACGSAPRPLFGTVWVPLLAPQTQHPRSRSGSGVSSGTARGTSGTSDGDGSGCSSGGEGDGGGGGGGNSGTNGTSSGGEELTAAKGVLAVVPGSHRLPRFGRRKRGGKRGGRQPVPASFPAKVPTTHPVHAASGRTRVTSVLAGGGNGGGSGSGGGSSNGVWATTTFRSGDAVFFHTRLVHASSRNNSTTATAALAATAAVTTCTADTQGAEASARASGSKGCSGADAAGLARMFRESVDSRWCLRPAGRPGWGATPSSAFVEAIARQPPPLGLR